MRAGKLPTSSRILRIISVWRKNKRSKAGRAALMAALLCSLLPIAGNAVAQTNQSQQPAYQQNASATELQQQYAQQQQQQYPQQNAAGQPVAPATRPMTAEERAALQQARGQAPQVNYQPQLPAGFPISAKEQKYIEELLDYWQQSSDEVKRSTWDFARWDYDPEFCNYNDPETGNLLAAAFSRGQIRFSAPDKGRFDVTESMEFYIKDPGTPTATPDYRARDESKSRERWICDGDAIYQYDYEAQRIYQTDIPPELRGQGLANSPLPFFLFGANRQMILERYWVHVVTPEGVENEYWLEVHPKRAEDARNYKKIVVIISREDFLPSSLEVFAANYDPANNQLTRRVFAFENRIVNDAKTGITDFLKVFVKPLVPPGWKYVNSADMVSEQMQDANSAQNPNLQTQDR